MTRLNIKIVGSHPHHSSSMIIRSKAFDTVICMALSGSEIAIYSKIKSISRENIKGLEIKLTQIRKPEGRGITTMATKLKIHADKKLPPSSNTDSTMVERRTCLREKPKVFRIANSALRFLQISLHSE